MRPPGEDLMCIAGHAFIGVVELTDDQIGDLFAFHVGGAMDAHRQGKGRSFFIHQQWADDLSRFLRERDCYRSAVRRTAA